MRIFAQNWVVRARTSLTQERGGHQLTHAHLPTAGDSQSPRRSEQSTGSRTVTYMTFSDFAEVDSNSPCRHPCGATNTKGTRSGALMPL